MKGRKKEKSNCNECICTTCINRETCDIACTDCEWKLPTVYCINEEKYEQMSLFKGESIDYKSYKKRE